MYKFTTITCPLCGYKKFTVLFKSTLEKNDFSFNALQNHLKNTLNDFSKHGQIVKCIRCSLVYVNPQENLYQLLKGYNMVVDYDYLQTEKYRKLLFSKHLKELIKFSKKGKLLDIGCFCGFFLELAKKKGFKVYGVEPSDWARDIAKKRKITILGKSMKDISKRKFDIVTLFDVIEHLGNPKSELKKIRRSLNNNGILVVGTPNIESLTVKLLKGKHPFFIRMHVVLFGRRTLVKLLEEVGFTVRQVTYYGRTYPFYYYLERLIQILPKKKILFRLSFRARKYLEFPITVNFRDEMLVIAQKN